MSATPGDDQEVTHDTLLRGRVKLLQPARGYRSSLDPVLLAAFLAPPYGRVLDIGCGTGALAFLLLARDDQATAVGVEIQPRLAQLAARGARENGFEARFDLRQRDVRSLGDVGVFDLVVVNPPFRALGSGVLPRDEERSVANYEVSLTLAEWLDAAAARLAPRGRLGVVFPANRWEELCAGVRARSLAPTRFRPVASQAEGPALRMLAEVAPAPACELACEPTCEPTLVVHSGGSFSTEVREMVGELRP